MDKKYIIAAAAVLMLTACSNTAAPHENGADGTMSATASVTVLPKQTETKAESSEAPVEEEMTTGTSFQNGKLRILYSGTYSAGASAEFAVMDEGIVHVDEIDIDSHESSYIYGYEFSGENDGETVICINRYEGAIVIGEAYSVVVRDGKIVDYQLTETDGFDLDYIRDVADTSTYTEQTFPQSRLESALTENNPAVPAEIIVCAKGNAVHTVTVSDYTGHMRNDDSRATVGEPVEISGDISGGRITFKLSEDYFLPDYTERMTEMTGGELPDNVNLSGLLICCSNGEDPAEPLETEFDADTRTLTAEIKSGGIYLVVDVFAMLDYLGVGF